MLRPCTVLVCAFLGACATTNSYFDSEWSKPMMTGPLLAAAAPEAATEVGPEAAAGAAQEAAVAPENAVLPLGFGLTTGPKTFLLGGTLDFPLDKQLTFGPSLQWGIDDDYDLFAVSGQLKYFLPISDGDAGGLSLLPYLTGGVGVATLDKPGRSRESGLLLNGGAGVRFLTGENYRIGTEARLNFLPDKLAGEHSYMSFELLQIVITF